jgi:hypothetical protein
VAKVYEVCSLDIANIFLDLLLPQAIGRQCGNLKFTHPFDGLYWNAPIHLEGCIGNLKDKK